MRDRTTMNAPKRFLVGDAGAQVAVAQWGEPASDKPPALLLHGTGFVAEVWTEVAEALAADYTVYALDRRGHGLMDNWLRHIKDVAARHAAALEPLPEPQRAAKLAELNAIEQARNVCYTSVVQEAWAAGRRLTVRAWIYGVQDGLLRDLRFAVSDPEELAPAYRLSLESEAA
jgi:hypothetical protein